MADADKDDDAAFQMRLEPVVRELGQRGRAKPSDAVSLAKGPAAAAASATTTPSPAALAPEGGPVAARSPQQPIGGTGTGTGYSLDELTAFMERQHTIQMERDAQAKADMAELEAKFEAKLEAQRQEMLQKHAPSVVVITDEQFAALQLRLEALHASQLVTSDELGVIEDLCADFAEVQAAVGGVMTNELLLAFEPAAKLKRLVGVSEKIQSDAAFARQVRRKFVV
jgi:hypothetical protein